MKIANFSFFPLRCSFFFVFFLSLVTKELYIYAADSRNEEDKYKNGKNQYSHKSFSLLLLFLNREVAEEVVSFLWTSLSLSLSLHTHLDTYVDVERNLIFCLLLVCLGDQLSVILHSLFFILHLVWILHQPYLLYTLILNRFYTFNAL